MENNIYELQYAMDTFYFLVMGALVMWMAAGFSMLEAGLVRSKSTTEILTKNIALYAIACTAYLVVGYELMYGGGLFLEGIALDGAKGIEDLNDAAKAFIADAVKTALAADPKVDVTAVQVQAAAIFDSKKAGFSGGSVYSDASDFFFQVVFVATAMSIVSGAVAERMKLWAFLLFAVVMTAFIYPIEGGWTWGGNPVGLFGIELFNLGDADKEKGLAGFGFSDFAGSGIVHMAGAAAALAAVLLLGARKGKYHKDGSISPIPGANLPMATLGTFILWMGWFGFNGGSVLKLGDITNSNAVAMVFLNTNAAAAGGVIVALIVARLMFGKADLTMTLNGALAGLVAITAEPSTPTPLMALIIGGIGGLIVVFSILALDKMRIDDPVGAISVHGVVGFWGLMAVPLTKTGTTFVGQLVGAATIFIWVFFASLIVWLVIKMIMGIRVSQEEEYEGVDIGECGMEAYPEFTNK
ncbi:MAG TPA: ammonium transporter [Leucothrix mucor]|nr:ammonium transporter [Leucothrix mucor]